MVKMKAKQTTMKSSQTEISNLHKCPLAGALPLHNLLTESDFINFGFIIEIIEGTTIITKEVNGIEVSAYLSQDNNWTYSLKDSTDSVIELPVPFNYDYQVRNLLNNILGDNI
jgi:hypothetical protein